MKMIKIYIVTLLIIALSGCGGAGSGDNSVSEGKVIDTSIIVNNDINGSEKLLITFNFSENMTGFTMDDIDISIGTKDDFTGSGKTYILSFIPPSNYEGEIRIGIERNVAKNIEGIGNSSQNVVFNISTLDQLDEESPRLEITNSSDGIATSSIIYTFRFSEAVTGFSSNDIFISNGSKGTLEGSGLLYTLEIIPPEDFEGDIVVEVLENSVVDLAGNGNIGTTYTQTFNTTIVESFGVTITNDSGDIASGDITYSFIFSQIVTGFSIDDITLTNGTKVVLQGEGLVYTLVVTPIEEASGIITLTLKENSVFDTNGNGNSMVTHLQEFDTITTSNPVVNLPPVGGGGSSVTQIRIVECDDRTSGVNDCGTADNPYTCIQADDLLIKDTETTLVEIIHVEADKQICVVNGSAYIER